MNEFAKVVIAYTQNSASTRARVYRFEKEEEKRAFENVGKTDLFFLMDIECNPPTGYLITKEEAIPLTRGLLSNEDTKRLIQFVSNPLYRMSKESIPMLKIFSEIFYPETHLGYWIDMASDSREEAKEFILGLYFAVSSRSALEILAKAGLFHFIKCVFTCDNAILNPAGNNPSEILELTREEIKFLNSPHGAFYWASVPIENTKKIVSLAKAYGMKPDKPLDERQLSVLDALLEVGPFISRKEVDYALKNLEGDELIHLVSSKRIIGECYEEKTSILEGFRLDDKLSIYSKEDEIDLRLQRRHSYLSEYEYEYDGLKIVSPQSTREYLQGADTLHNCLNEYLSEYCDGWCDIFFVKDESDNILAALEIRGHTLLQARLRFNKAIAPESPIGRVIVKWMEAKQVTKYEPDEMPIW